MNSLINQLKHLEIFQDVNDRTIESVIKASDIKNYDSGEIIFEDKEKVTTIYIVINGFVSLYKMNENGQKKVIFVLGRGKVINEVIIQELPASINCEVLQNAKVLCINREKLLGFMEEDFQLCKNIVISLSMKTRRLYRQLKNTPSSVKIEKRLAAKLYKLGIDYGKDYNGGTLIDMNMTITYMADLLGSQRETVSRAIKVLQNQNLIAYKNKQVFINDLKELAIFFKTL